MTYLFSISSTESYVHLENETIKITIKRKIIFVECKTEYLMAKINLKQISQINYLIYLFVTNEEKQEKNPVAFTPPILPPYFSALQ